MSLIGSGTRAKDIAVISPYAGQVRLLKLRISKKYPDISIGTVDGFQGLEKEAVILSLVRSNTKQVVGFLKDYRRINVAITRARRHLCVIANKQTVAYKSEFLESLFKHLDKYATKLSA
ncbi:DNA-binding protein SMUBP-2 [Coemansia sp. RSA 2399]|nr:DNA-binding protein SMUBP-2 [Coemansia sp. RSA 2399]